MQISGARVSTRGRSSNSGRPRPSQARSTALTPSAVETGHSENGRPPRKELQQKSKHLALAVGVPEARRGRHKDMSMPISLDPVGELREILVGQDLGPSSQVEPGLRSEIRKFNSDRHATKIHQKRKKRDEDESVKKSGVKPPCGLAPAFVV